MKSLLMIILTFTAFNLNAQVEPISDYKISNIKVIPFDSKTGEFAKHTELTYYNAISTSLFVIVEVSGKPGIFESKKKVEIEVFEGEKRKAKKIEKNMLFSEKGKFYISLLLDPLMCKDITINARILGQKTDSGIAKMIPFKCGE
ncbi:MAG: hypothetical protein KBF93_12260 [Leptospiraceae bacterium]|nr:hypothetical protein [Leptospiraceae bacterium]